MRNAVDDTTHRPVIACVLNDIDDALDRSDPIGTVWTTDRFKRLDALLSAAAAVGRTVVLVSDHGTLSNVVSSRACNAATRFRHGIVSPPASMPRRCRPTRCSSTDLACSPTITARSSRSTNSCATPG
ncbi:hypothetical protein P9209_23560 [Prescottella defluvii]|nr:hypothetical protein P9209_23560 [Prescottella defluvii]